MKLSLLSLLSRFLHWGPPPVAGSSAAPSPASQPALPPELLLIIIDHVTVHRNVGHARQHTLENLKQLSLVSRWFNHAVGEPRVRRGLPLVRPKVKVDVEPSDVDVGCAKWRGRVAFSVSVTVNQAVRGAVARASCTRSIRQLVWQINPQTITTFKLTGYPISVRELGHFSSKSILFIESF